VRAAKLAICD
jgi:hypothetical protein